MATKKKMLMSSAGSAGAGGAGGLDITDVFSTYLYEGTGSTQTITNGIDLDGEGGLVWIKDRINSNSHAVFDTERGALKLLNTNNTNVEWDYGAAFNLAYNSNGFNVGGGSWIGASGNDYASWTFRKAPKFFTCLTYTGTGSAQNISHDLGSDVGFLLIKRTDSTSNWRCWHRGLPSTGSNMEFNQTGAYETSTAIFNGTDPTSTQFSVGTNSNVNASGGTYVAYLFAHNDGDGEFGPDGDQDIIKCGSYVGNESSFPTIDLGFEPQFLLLKSATSTENWHLIDTTRGFLADGTNSSGDFKYLWADSATSEGGNYGINVTSTGFELTSANAHANSNGNTFIYMAIRRGPLAPPESATEVFAAHKETTSNLNQNPPFLQPAPFAVDFISNKMFGGASSWWSATRLTNARLQFESTAAETSVSTSHEFDHNDGVAVNGLSGSTNFMGYMWKRAPSFCDVVAYTGNSAAGRTLSHNLGAVPEMMWVKSRSNVSNWQVYHSGIGATKYLELNSAAAVSTNSARWNDTTPSSSTFTLGNDDSVNVSGRTYIAYLFASLDGVSKVGSLTHSTGTRTYAECGFSAGARFVLYKYTDSSQQLGTNEPSNWHVFDATRGIVGGIDPRLSLNTTDAQITTGNDYIDPYSGGFSLPAAHPSGTYIFYAIA